MQRMHVISPRAEQDFKQRSNYYRVIFCTELVAIFEREELALYESEGNLKLEKPVTKLKTC